MVMSYGRYGLELALACTQVHCNFPRVLFMLGSLSVYTELEQPTITESARIVPILCTNVTTVVSRYTTAIDDDTEDDETKTSNNLDR